jgi:hypothetical protein
MQSAQANLLTTFKNKSSQDIELENHLCEQLFSLVQGPGVPFRRQFMPAVPVNKTNFTSPETMDLSPVVTLSTAWHAGVLFRYKNKS